MYVYLHVHTHERTQHVVLHLALASSAAGAVAVVDFSSQSHSRDDASLKFQIETNVLRVHVAAAVNLCCLINACLMIKKAEPLRLNVYARSTAGLLRNQVTRGELIISSW